MLKLFPQESKLAESQARVSSQIQGYMPILEGYRGLACLLVFLMHFYSDRFNQNQSILGSIYDRILTIGWCGVDAFFVLSGFLITGILLDNKDRVNYFKNFYFRRILRIFPLYYFVLIIIFFALNSLFIQDESYRHLETLQSWYWLYLQNWEVTIHSYASFHILSHFWSLAIEEQFYLFWPFIIYFLPKRFLGLVIAIFLIIPLLLRNILLFQNLPPDSLNILYMNTFCRMDSLAIGAAIAFGLRSEYWQPIILRYSRLLLFLSSASLSVIFIVRGGLNPVDFYIQSLGYSLLAILFASLLVFSLSIEEGGTFPRLLSWFPLRYLGRISYGFYVYHYLALFLFRDSLTQYTLNLTHSYWLSEILVFLCFAIAIAAIASLSWVVLEKPILKLKKYFPTRQSLTALKTDPS
ncbi:MAG: acyltransferase [Cyanobacteria bacterium SBLK]|nr:acyltransferase [Cyanobacteria bacterium SBLK]